MIERMKSVYPNLLEIGSMRLHLLRFIVTQIATKRHYETKFIFQIYYYCLITIICSIHFTQIYYNTREGT